jgi:hypothetical protein
MAVHVVTVANKSDGYYEILKESCIRNGCELVTLGFGEKWGGYVWRFKKIQEYLKTIKSDDIVVFVDGFDVVMTEHTDIVMEKYKTFERDIVLSVAYECDYSKLIAKRLYKFVKYNGNEYSVNAGLYMGKCGTLLKMYDLIDRNHGFKNYNDDQLLISVFLNNNRKFMNKYIALDTKATLFNNAMRVNIKDYVFDSSGDKQLNISCKNNQILNTFKQPSSFLHGPASARLTPYLEKLGYENIPDIVPLSNARALFYSKLFLAGMFWYDWVIVFIVLIIIAFTIVLTISIVRAVRDKKLVKKKKISVI